MEPAACRSHQRADVAPWIPPSVSPQQLLAELCTKSLESQVSSAWVSSQLCLQPASGQGNCLESLDSAPRTSLGILRTGKERLPLWCGKEQLTLSCKGAWNHPWLSCHPVHNHRRGPKNNPFGKILFPFTSPRSDSWIKELGGFHSCKEC